MFLANIVFAVFVCTSVTKYVFVSSQGDERLPEIHTFVALIDILFADGTKRTCTGTIIHDNAVITAAHCFLNHGSEYTDVELSGSFIVIGTKKMFDTGYENYLAIERVITHPNYKGWTADLALVFTFVGMTTDKPGHIVPIVEESEQTPVDSNVTILSWANYCDEQVKKTTNAPAGTKRPCENSKEASDESCESRKHRPLRQNSKERANSGEGHKGSKLEPDTKHRSFQAKVNSESTTMVVPSIMTSNSGAVRSTMNIQTPSQDEDRDHDRYYDRNRDRDETKESKETKGSNEHTLGGLRMGDTTNEPSQSKETQEATEVKKPNLSIHNPYLMPTKGKEKKKVTSPGQTTKKHRYAKTYRLSSNAKNQKEDTSEKEQDWSKILDTVIQRAGLNVSKVEKNATLSIESRRSGKRHKHAPQKENKLTIETFGFVNVQTCKKLIDKTLPKLYRINTNEVVCYAADDHFISDDDSGAPAIREGRLVAVTVGGAECDGDHVAVGMKMTCYCSWILQNLPPGETNLECCTDCCGEENDKNDKKVKKDHSDKNYHTDETYLRSNHKRKLLKRFEENDE